MGQPSENVPIQEQYAVQLLGKMAERVSEEKGTKQILNHTAGPTTKDKPLNAAGASDTRDRPAGNSKKGKDDPKPPDKPSNCGGKGHTTHECDKPKPPKKPKGDGKNTGGGKGKSTGNTADKGKGAPSTGKGNPSTGKSGGKGAKSKAKAKDKGKAKPKAAAASAEVEVEEPQ
eukprot:352645-Amphidinium_carterae.1